MSKLLSEEVKNANREAYREALERFLKCYTPAEMMINRFVSDFGKKVHDFTYIVEDENGIEVEAEGKARLSDFASPTAKKALAKHKAKICRAVPKWYKLRNTEGKEAEEARSEIYRDIIVEVVEYLRLCTCGIVAVNKGDIKTALASGVFLNEGGNIDCSPSAVEKAITGIYYNIIQKRKAFNAYECRVSYREKLNQYKAEVRKRLEGEAEAIVQAKAFDIANAIEAEAEAEAKAEAKAEAVKAEAKAEAVKAEAVKAEAVKAEAETKKSNGKGKGKAKAEKVA